ncbi:MAG TPA: ANTAR domain-containing protein [Nocardioidaceae bacterium]|nr:ANTAR domain-containing protein [Nocardioidaceae bacterium]
MFELAVLEQAKGVLMFRYGIGSFEALAVLERWSHETGETLANLSRAITHGICQGHSNPTPDNEFLVRWLEQQFRQPLSTDIAHAPEEVTQHA